MSKTISLSLSHNLPQDEVKRRLVTAIADARSKQPDLLKGAQVIDPGPQIIGIKRCLSTMHDRQ